MVGLSFVSVFTVFSHWLEAEHLPVYDYGEADASGSVDYMFTVSKV